MTVSGGKQHLRDALFMRAALDAAATAQFATSPNPMVGAVVVRDDAVIATGVHLRAGQAHAEVSALAGAGAAAAGSELFITLEPCCHQGRTPPCVDAIIASGVRRCVVAMQDPNPLVSGGGIARLRDAGITVDVGVLREDSERLNQFFLTWVTRRTPFVTAKFAASMDGRIATRTGESQWITSEEGRRIGHVLREQHDAVLVGAGTVIADDPQLTARAHVGARSPVRVVLDSTARVPASARAFGPGDGGAVLATTGRADPGKLRQFEDRGAQVLVLPSGGPGERVDLPALVAELGRADVTSLLVEGGPSVLGAFFDAGLVDRVVAVIAPRIIGGALAMPAVGGVGTGLLSAAPLLSDVVVDRAGPDIVVTGYCRS